MLSGHNLRPLRTRRRPRCYQQLLDFHHVRHDNYIPLVTELGPHLIKTCVREVVVEANLGTKGAGGRRPHRLHTTHFATNLAIKCATYSWKYGALPSFW